MVKRIEVAYKDNFFTKQDQTLIQNLNDFIGEYLIEKLTSSLVYYFEPELEVEDALFLAQEVLSDSLTQHYSFDKPVVDDFDLAVEIRYLPAVKDNHADAAFIAAKDALGEKFKSNIRTAKIYFLKGKIDKIKLEEFAKKELSNPLVETLEIFHKDQSQQFYSAQKDLFVQNIKVDQTFEYIPLKNNSQYLEQLSKKRLLALSVKELKAIYKYFSKPSVVKARQKEGLQPMPTDVELECIAQTWSEHCKHKIFNSTISYTQKINNKTKKMIINSLFKTYIVRATKAIKNKYCISAFFDNAGVLAIDENWALAVKCETHNAPSALDPFGGALTGILGVNRDILGTGLGAKPIFNTDVFCFASPFYDKKLPPNVIHPKKIFQGVKKGIEHGGNASGIPTINGSIVFDDSYLGRPLVFCGSGGLIPIKVNGIKAYQKHIKPKDRIFMVGGRIGKDGIHGATFSSQAIGKGSSSSAVQIGDPFTQKKVIDFLIESRDKGLHSGLTDNGAGGLSSSVGELALLTNGATVHLERCPLKYSGLTAWEIFLSESQERMSVAVPPSKAGDFILLAKKHDVEVSDIGEFNDSGYLKVTYYGKTVLYLDLKFLHKGLPKLKLDAIFSLQSENKNKELKNKFKNKIKNQKLIKIVQTENSDFSEQENYNSDLLDLLGSLNICSRENVIRQYDHEVLGMSVIKPLCGLSCSGPADGAVISPFFDKKIGIFISNGIAPKYSDYDCFLMAQHAVDEAVRNYLAIGGDLHHWAALDNFCWPDPIKSAKNPDGDKKLGQLVRANLGLYEIAKAYFLPFISGKDSMKNDYIFDNIKISIKPTLLITIVGVSNIENALTSDFKNEGDLIYVVGHTYEELAGSEYIKLKQSLVNMSLNLEYPKINLEQNLRIYKKLAKAIKLKLLNSCHDCSDGGLAVALAECAIGSKKGAELDLSNIANANNLSQKAVLFAESAGRFVVSLPPSKKEEFENIFGQDAYLVGKVKDNKLFNLKINKKLLISLDVEQMLAKFTSTLSGEII